MKMSEKSKINLHEKRKEKGNHAQKEIPKKRKLKILMKDRLYA